MNKRLMCWGVILSCILLGGCGKNSEQNNSMVTDETDREPIVLTYGYIDAYSFWDLDAEVKKRIVDFNRSQNEYYVEIKQYGEDSYQDGLTALNADIAAGKGPDIIQIDNAQLLKEYAAKRTIVDLYSFMEEDSKLQKEDFLENILQQFEVDGKLCGLVSHFTINSTIGNPNLMDSEEITFSQLRSLIEENKENEDIVVYQNMNKEGALAYCIDPELELFVDWENKTCDFHADDFLALLEFSNEFDYMAQAVDLGNEIYIKMQNNELYMIYDGPITSFQSYTKYKSLFGEDAILLGWPTVNGSGVEISPSSACSYWAINSNSKEQDAAWQFICSFFEEDYLLADQNTINGFPVLKSAFEKCAENAMKRNMVEDASGNQVEVPQEVTFTDVSGLTISYPIYAATEEEVAYIENVIENSSPAIDYGEIGMIIYEEVQDYWEGTKSLEDVVDVIQNKAQLYLDEIN